MDQNNQGRRPHHHRGRRGPDRRGNERRQHQSPSAGEGSVREQVREGADVEQIMREIRARISQRHGIDLSPQQIQELAARRLEAILDPRAISPSLLDQMRRSTASIPDQPAPAPAYTFHDTTLYDTHRGLLRGIRRLLNPILKLFFNPNPIVQALNTQASLNVEAAVREAERERRQAEWNALHYDILQRLVTENSRLSLELQAMALRVESLGAKVDFNERRVRGLEVPGPGTRHQPPAQPRATPPPPPTQEAPAATPPPAADSGGSPPAGDATADGARRRRRRRRGRRSGSTFAETAAPGAEAAGAEAAVDGDEGDGADIDETAEETAPGESGESESPAMAERPLDAPVAVEAAIASEPHPPFPAAARPPAVAAATAPDADDGAPRASSTVEPPPLSAPPDDPGPLPGPGVDPGPPDR